MPTCFVSVSYTHLPEIGDHEIRPANRGDNHYWGVWHEKHKFEEYEKNIGRFISEHGFQSFPEFETVRQYTLPEDYDIESEIMSAHQRSGIGNLRIREYMGWYYPVSYTHLDVYKRQAIIPTDNNSS